ncbi:MAG: ROK family glucokinase [Phycisphaerae bacterium]|jgi:glucokinase
MNGELAIGIDLGATNLKGAMVDRQGRVIAKHARPLPTTGPEDVVNEIVVVIDHFLATASAQAGALTGVGIGAPGPMEYAEGTITRAANLPGWEDVPLRDMLEERLDASIAFDNDGNAAAYGEYWVGAGSDDKDLVMLTLGTGVGAGVILGGRVLHGHFENAAELGHMIVVANGLACPCGQRGCLEQYASASAVARRVVTAVRNGESSALSEAIRNGGGVDAKRVAGAARAGDALCTRVWNEACLYLAIACVNIQHAYNPARIVLGGGMADAGEFLIKNVTRHVTQQRWSLHDDHPEIRLAELGYDAGVIGAAGLVWAQHR